MTSLEKKVCFAIAVLIAILIPLCFRMMRLIDEAFSAYGN